MNQTRYEPFPILIESFFDCVDICFKFLSTDHGYVESKRLIQHEDKEIEFIPDKFPKSKWIFMVLKRYENQDGTFIVSYGDRESIVELKYRQKKDESLFGVWEIFNAKNLDYSEIGGNQFVLNQDFMIKTIETISNSLRNNIENILPISNDLFKTISVNRDIVQQDWEDRMLNDTISFRVDEAAKEFQKKNYKRVVEILDEYSDKLSEAQKKNLDYSKKMIKKKSLFRFR